jgi:CarD family transcriptional regulator
MKKGGRLKLNVGDKISYPSHGPCLVGPVVKRVVGGKLTAFHNWIVLDGGGEFLVPVDQPQAGGIRRLLEKSEIPKLLAHIKKATRSAEKWNQRNKENSRLFTSGSAFDLAEIVGSMSELRETKRLQPSDRQTLARAKKLLVCEISEVMGEERSAVEEKIDKILEGRKGNKGAGTKAARDWPQMEDYGEVL